MKTYTSSLIFSIFILLVSFFLSGYKYTPHKGTYISLAPSITEVIYAINAQNNLLAVTMWSDYPEDAKKKPQVGDAIFINKEAIIKLKPEIIFAVENHKILIDDLKNIGIQVYYFPSRNIDDVYTNILTIGKITGRKSKSEHLVKALKNEQNKLKPVKKRKKIFYVVQGEPLITIGSDTFIGDLIKKSGQDSITASIKGSYIKVNQEYVISKHPDIVYVYDKETANYLSPYIKSKYVVLTEQQKNILNRPGPRIIQSLKIFSSL